MALAARLRALVDRLRAFIARLFRRAKAPGRFETGRARSWRGYLTTAPRVEPARDYVVYIPAGWSPWKRAPLLVLLHGCRQTAQDIAALTRITRYADAQGMLVLLPRQTHDANEWDCWNWFEANTARGAGEAAIVAAQIVDVRRRYRARRERVWVAGLSAGGSIAAILGLRHPRLVRGVLVHSGLACGAAATPASALRVMRDGPDTDVARIADEAYADEGRRTFEVALLVIHGNRDEIVALRNADALVRQYLRFNRSHLAPLQEAYLPPSDAMSHEAGGMAHAHRADDWQREIDVAALAPGLPRGVAARRALVRRIVVEGLGHAWSGGDAAFAYADPRGPDALVLFANFRRECATEVDRANK